ncbi:MAG: RNA 2',3'-cyclic phosphodiesterase [Deltaproteobacteria bacterium]|nr:RNA 2',3'-cyclic phosphodiesterase [Deltaproteobacteria bacterium]
MRLFVAVNLCDQVKAELLRLQEILLRRCPEIRPIAAAQMHLTLKFLGEVEDANLPAARSAMQHAALQNASFTARLCGCGCFPEKGRLRVVWVGLDAADGALTTLNQSLEECFEAGGFSREDRSFSAHITIGRARREGAGPKVRNVVAGLEPKPLEQPVASISLIESRLEPAGPNYSVLAEECLR